MSETRHGLAARPLPEGDGAIGRAWGQEGGCGASALGSGGLSLANLDFPLLRHSCFLKTYNAPIPSPSIPRGRDRERAEAWLPFLTKGTWWQLWPWLRGRVGGASPSPAGRGQQRAALLRRGAHRSPASARAPCKGRKLGPKME